MTEDIKIVKATTRDIDRIIEIEEKSYTDPWPKEIFMVDYLFNNSSTYFVIKLNGQITGFMGIWEEEGSLHLINIAVDPAYRMKGYGKRMLQFFIELALKKKVKNVYLEARKSNLIAQKLYYSFGFTKIEELQAYYQDGEDGIRMSKALTKED